MMTRTGTSYNITLDHGARVLFLDDMEDRHAAFKNRTAGTRVVHVWTAEEACSKLLTCVFDVVFLDHDLADEHYDHDASVDGVGDGTGLQVAGWIAANACELRARDEQPFVVVHSLNPAGSQRMLDVLAEAGVPAVRAPFNTLLPGLRVKAPPP